MKQWTKDDLILLYYQELDDLQSQALSDAIETSDELKKEYEDICAVLGNVTKEPIPAPSNKLNHRIMANIAEMESQSKPLRRAKSKLAPFSLIREKISQLISPDQWGGFAAASVAIALVIVGVFYMGRISVDLTPVGSVRVTHEQNNISNKVGQYAFDERASRRILLTNVSSHLETGERLLTMVSNSSEDNKVDLSSRSQMLEDMIGFNRLYRRIAERSNDVALVSVLQQMERVLLQLRHADDDRKEVDIKGIRLRLEDSDLLFKLKVTNKKISREII